MLLAEAPHFAEELSAIYVSDWARLRRLAARIVGEDRAEEVVQEAVMKLWRAPERFDPERGNLGAYLAVLCRGAAIDRLRSDTARAAREIRSARESGPAWRADTVEPGTENEVDVLVRLPERERTPIRLAVYDGLSYRQIATSLGLPEGTVKSRIRAGLRRLRTTIEADSLRA